MTQEEQKQNPIDMLRDAVGARNDAELVGVYQKLSGPVYTITVMYDSRFGRFNFASTGVRMGPHEIADALFDAAKVAAAQAAAADGREQVRRESAATAQAVVPANDVPQPVPVVTPEEAPILANEIKSEADLTL